MCVLLPSGETRNYINIRKEWSRLWDRSSIVTLIAKCPPHVHQQVPHRDVLALIQHAGPFVQVPMETGKYVGVHTSLIILLKEGIYIEAPERVCHLHPWIGRLKDWHIQSCRCQLFPLPTPSVATAPMPAARHLTCSGVSIRVWCSPVWGRGGEPPLLTVVYWDFRSLPHGCTTLVWVVSLASVLSPTPKVLLSC